jgi:hypothetical protein
MIKKLGTFAILLLSLTAFAQTETAPTAPAKRYSRPDVPGTFVVEIGFNNAQNKPNNFAIGFWGSRTVNLYWQYDMRILKSRFSFVPGIGLSLERIKFNDDRTFGYVGAGDSLKMLTGKEAGYPVNLKKSSLVTNYLEIPLEIKYSTKPDDPSRSFKISVGGRIGVMYDSFSKIKYVDDGENKKVKSHEQFNLNRIRYGVYTKIGVGNISLFGYYNLTNLFKDGEGPISNGDRKDFSTFTMGISLASF